MDDAKLLPMLDGLDELKSVRQEPCVSKINDFLQSGRRPVYMIVCSRRDEYEKVIRGQRQQDKEEDLEEISTKQNTRLHLNGAIILKPLKDHQIQAYLAGLNQLDLWKILQLDSRLLKLVRTPLFLSILGFISFHKTLSIQNWKTLTSSEARLEYLFDAYWKAAINRELVPREVHLKRFKSLSYQKKKPPNSKKTRKWLMFLAEQLQKESQTEFLIDKIQPNCLKNKYQKFMYGLVTSVIAGFVAGISVVMLLGAFEVEGYKDIFLYRRFPGRIYGLSVGIGVGFATAQDGTIQTVETLSWSWKEVWRNFAFAPLFGLSKGLTNGKEIEMKTTPNEGIS
ncbi:MULTISPECIES: NACHT domain-containing protein [Fischerella]|uniref:NACHT domain-containing protein n=1 Tax=Fischerella muscicola CCMEE 5323 TaxID=2019572 RepID=A0A2N6JX48_FISMU|nr:MULTISPECIES: hypothetical protein [Fischerella]MBD2432304.1 hypothetical protein [Fischerella sp. FACHB-380]PLZ84843.1 hypothetical protein CEN44_23655 [Fischerella muscicola CCMEE 5323]